MHPDKTFEVHIFLILTFCKSFETIIRRLPLKKYKNMHPNKTFEAHILLFCFLQKRLRQLLNDFHVADSNVLLGFGVEHNNSVAQNFVVDFLVGFVVHTAERHRR